MTTTTLDKKSDPVDRIKFGVPLTLDMEASDLRSVAAGTRHVVADDYLELLRVDQDEVAGKYWWRLVVVSETGRARSDVFADPLDALMWGLDLVAVYGYTESALHRVPR